jgi:hypothetical protein
MLSLLVVGDSLAIIYWGLLRRDNVCQIDRPRIFEEVTIVKVFYNFIQRLVVFVDK